jgi:hypothetical protein
MIAPEPALRPTADTAQRPCNHLSITAETGISAAECKYSTQARSAWASASAAARFIPRAASRDATSRSAAAS